VWVWVCTHAPHSAGVKRRDEDGLGQTTAGGRTVVTTLRCVVHQEALLVVAGPRDAHRHGRRGSPGSAGVAGGSPSQHNTHKQALAAGSPVPPSAPPLPAASTIANYSRTRFRHARGCLPFRGSSTGLWYRQAKRTSTIPTPKSAPTPPAPSRAHPTPPLKYALYKPGAVLGEAQRQGAVGVRGPQRGWWAGVGLAGHRGGSSRKNEPAPPRQPAITAPQQLPLQPTQTCGCKLVLCRGNPPHGAGGSGTPSRDPPSQRLSAAISTLPTQISPTAHQNALRNRHTKEGTRTSRSKPQAHTNQPTQHADNNILKTF
jgi:hypothetical protein